MLTPNDVLTYLYISYAIVVTSLILNVQVIKLAHWLRRQRILRIIRILIIDWFAYTPRWLGAYPIIWVIYLLGLLDLVPSIQGKLALLSIWFNVPVFLISIALTVIGAIIKSGDIVIRFPDLDFRGIESRIYLYLILEILAIGYAFVFGPLGLWEFLIHNESIKMELLLASLVAPNIISIIARANIRESTIAEHFLRVIGR